MLDCWVMAKSSAGSVAVGEGDGVAVSVGMGVAVGNGVGVLVELGVWLGIMVAVAGTTVALDTVGVSTTAICRDWQATAQQPIRVSNKKVFFIRP